MVKNLPAKQPSRRPGFNSWFGKMPWSRLWQPAPVFLLVTSHGQRSLAGNSPWGNKELDTTKQVGEGNGNPLQYSCLENPMDGGTWWVAVYGVAKSWTRLSNFTFTFHFHALEKEMAPTPVFLPGESQGRGNLVGCRPRGRTESDTTEAT